MAKASNRYAKQVPRGDHLREALVSRVKVPGMDFGRPGILREGFPEPDQSLPRLSGGPGEVMWFLSDVRETVRESLEAGSIVIAAKVRVLRDGSRVIQR